MIPKRGKGLYLLLLICIAGCDAPTPDKRENRRVVDAILTAVTIKSRRLLDEDARLAKARHDQGQLTDEQYRELEAVVNKARAGDWTGAERDGYAFRKQHPFVSEGH